MCMINNYKTKHPVNYHQATFKIFINRSDMSSDTYHLAIQNVLMCLNFTTYAIRVIV